MTTHQQLPPPPAPELEPARRHGRFTSEVMAGGSVTEKDDDELVGGLRGLVGVIGVVALIGLLGLFNVWWLVFVVGVLIAIFMLRYQVHRAKAALPVAAAASRSAAAAACAE